MSENKIPFNRAILWIFVSILLVSGSAFMGWLYYLRVRERRYHDEQYKIVAIVQSTPQGDALKTVHLAEVLDLSLDKPVNLYQFNIKESTQKLLSLSVIKMAAMKKMLPGTLYLEYLMRKPYAFVGEFTNTVIDEEGFLFPFRPFFTPKYLPILYLGLSQEECQWGNCVKELPTVQLAFDLICQWEALHSDRFHLKHLDVTQAFEENYGKRQVVMLLKEKNGKWLEKDLDIPIFLRLSADHIEQDLRNFMTLQNVYFEGRGKERGKEKTIVIDFRIPHLAFIKPRILAWKKEREN